jgi:type I restriction enzyme S subunit
LSEAEHHTARESPFEIPDSWEWARLGEIGKLISGQDMTPDKYSSLPSKFPYLIGASNIKNGAISVNRWTNEPRSIAKQGDLLITCKGTIGSLAFLEHEQVHIARQIMAIRINKHLNRKYIKIFIDTYVSNLKAVAKSMIPGISRDNIINILLPVPPLAEQNRIVDVIEIIFKQLEKISAKIN